MARTITQQDLKAQSEEILRDVVKGESFVLMSDGVPVGDLVPRLRRRFVPSDELRRLVADLPRLDSHEFRRDMDMYGESPSGYKTKLRR